ncbi:MAG: FAD-dependent oxidoreductase [Pseudomonadota bacterium]
MRIAVIGTGISGLSAAWGLRRGLGSDADIVLYERRDYAGGHTATKTVDYDGESIAVETGFIVFNTLNYPNLTAFFEELDIQTDESSMSFSVSLHDGAFEWSGDGLRAVFAQKRNLVSPRFLWMLREIMRFNECSHKDRKAGRLTGLSLGEYMEMRRFSKSFRDGYLIPMGAAIWSTPRDQMLEFPAESFVQFLENHRLINIRRPDWRTVAGGSATYVAKVLQEIQAEVRLATPVTRVERHPGTVVVTDETGAQDTFDHAIIAAHSDQALAMLADPSEKEREVLGAIRYLPNAVYLHRDASLMPKRKRVWTSWNYTEDQNMDGQATLAVTYWMNRLQNIGRKYPLFVSLNPAKMPDPALTFGTFEYDHPQYDRAALNAQKALPALQGLQNTWYCGAYHGYGFHEDGMKAGIAVAEALGGTYPWRAMPKGPYALTEAAE